MKRSLTILLFVLPCFGQTGPDVKMVFPTANITVSNTIQIIVTASVKNQLPAPVIDRIK